MRATNKQLRLFVSICLLARDYAQIWVEFAIQRPISPSHNDTTAMDMIRKKVEQRSSLCLRSPSGESLCASLLVSCMFAYEALTTTTPTTTTTMPPCDRHVVVELEYLLKSYQSAYRLSEMQENQEIKVEMARAADVDLSRITSFSLSNAMVSKFMERFIPHISKL